MRGRYCNGFTHVVKKGESLYQISRRYRVPLGLILRANPYVNIYNLQVGQEICIPMSRNFSRMGNVDGAGNNMRVGEHWNEDGTNPLESVEIAQELMPEEEMPEATEVPDSAEVPAPGENGNRGTMTEMKAMEGEGEQGVYITESGKNLGDILSELGMTGEEFIKYNSLSEIYLEENVIIRLPKKI